MTWRWNLLIDTVFDLDDHSYWRGWIGREILILELVD